MRIRKRGNSGQALVETVLMLPLLLGIVLNAINFAYFFLIALNISAASRSSGIYSIMGPSTPAAIVYPNAGPLDCSNPAKTVSDLACQDLTGAVYSPSSSDFGVQVCSPSVAPGVLFAGTVNERTPCASYGMSSMFSFAPSEPDPELNYDGSAPAFLLNRVDVVYRFRTPIPLMPFNIVVLAAPQCTGSDPVVCTFRRHVEMRAM
jgi:hypothetical protein